MVGSLLVAVIFAAPGLLFRDLLPADSALPAAPTLALLVIPFYVLGAPLVHLLPLAKAKWLPLGRLPSETFLLPRFLVSFLATTLIGVALGCVLLAIAVDYRFLVLGFGQSVVAVAFVVAAGRRFKDHAGTEFVAPLQPFPFLRGRLRD